MNQSKRGVYVATDKDAAKAYVGSTENKDKRFYDHDSLLRKGIHHNYRLQEAYNAGHEFEVVFIPVQSDVDVLEVEQQLLNEFRNTGVLYNVALDALSPFKGQKHRPETLEVMRQKATGKKHSPETIEKLKVLAKERGVPRSTIEAGAAARRGKPLSPEHVEKVRTTSKERMTEEAREHLRQVNLGIPHSAEDIEKMKQIKRANSGRAVIIEGRTFGSVAEAAESYGIDPTLVRYRINSTSDQFKDWNYLE